MSFGQTNHLGEKIAVMAWPKQRQWSYSSVTQHNNCPQVIRFRKIERLEEPKSVHLERGLDVHGAVERYLATGERPEGTPFADNWFEVFDELRNRGVTPERKVAFNAAWELTEWFAADAWLRAVLDATVVDGDAVDVYEWKTGKKYDEHANQARLYALVALLLYPDKKVNIRLRYLDRYPESRDVMGFDHRHIEPLKKEFTEFSHAYLNDTLYPARPNRFCNWCHFRKSNGGPCSFA